MQDYEGAWVILLGVQYVFFREYCNTYELLLKSICNIRSSNSNMFFFSLTMQILMDKKLFLSNFE